MEGQPARWEVLGEGGASRGFREAVERSGRKRSLPGQLTRSGAGMRILMRLTPRPVFLPSKLQWWCSRLLWSETLEVLGSAYPCTCAQFPGTWAGRPAGISEVHCSPEEDHSCPASSLQWAPQVGGTSPRKVRPPPSHRVMAALSYSLQAPVSP